MWTKKVFWQESCSSEAISLDDNFSVIHRLRVLHPKYFQDFMKLLFELWWFATIHEAKWRRYKYWYKALSDGGIDLIFEQNNSRYFVQLKKYMNKQVSIKDVKEYWMTILDNKLWDKDEWIFITTSIFSDTSEKFAKEHGLVMVDYEGILELIELVAQSHKRKLENFLNSVNLSSNEEYFRYAKTCKKCYAPMQLRKDWHFYGCMNYHRTGCDYKI